MLQTQTTFVLGVKPLCFYENAQYDSFNNKPHDDVYVNGPLVVMNTYRMPLWLSFSTMEVFVEPALKAQFQPQKKKKGSESYSNNSLFFRYFI